MQGLRFSEIEKGAHPHVCVCGSILHSLLSHNTLPQSRSKGAPYLMGISILCLSGLSWVSLDALTIRNPVPDLHRLSSSVLCVVEVILDDFGSFSLRALREALCSDGCDKL